MIRTTRIALSPSRPDRTKVLSVTMIGLAALLVLQHASVGDITHHSRSFLSANIDDMPSWGVFRIVRTVVTPWSVLNREDYHERDGQHDELSSERSSPIRHVLRMRKVAAEYQRALGAIPGLPNDRFEEIPPVLETWRYKPSRQSSEIMGCRVHRAITSCTNTIILAASLRQYDAILSKCGLPAIEYASNDDQLTSRVVKKYSTEEGEFPTHGLDVFGLWKLRDHMPHFLTDFIPNILLFDLVLGRDDRIDVKYDCFLKNGRSCSALQTQRLRQKIELRPALILNDRLMEKDNKSWVKALVSLLPNDPEGPHLLYRPNVFNSKSAMMHFQDVHISDSNRADLCSRHVPFRSVLSLRKPKEDQFRRHIDNNVLFTESSIDRSCRQDWTHKSKVLILNRDSNDSRHMIGVDKIVRNLKLKVPGLRIEEVNFDIMPFDSQVEKMNSANVVIGVHGAALTNLMFLKSGSHLIEIMPFGWTAGLFGQMASYFNVRYTSIRAQPQVDQVSECIEESGREHPSQKLARAAFLDAFERIAEEFPSPDQKGLDEIEQFTQHARIERVRVCLRGQTLAPDVNHLVGETADGLRRYQCPTSAEVE